MSFNLEGRKALVTGASRGIGRGIAVAYAQAGADVAVSARDEALLNEVADEIRALGRKAVVVPADVTDQEQVASAIQAAAEGLDGLNVLVNNAGGNSFSAPLAGMRISGWEKTFKLNVDSIVYACQAAAPFLFESGDASVINVSSIASKGGIPLMSHYGAAKAAVSSFTQSLAAEWAHQGTRVNSLVPGWVDTDLTEFLRGSDEVETAVLSRVMLQRWGTVREIAEPAVFLASNASSFMTGQELVVDGGLSAQV
ncbi:MAG: SDR family NAD(P)-dependent oxidoreductase [Candidatus Nanopelagicales bacterium]